MQPSCRRSTHWSFTASSSTTRGAAHPPRSRFSPRKPSRGLVLAWQITAPTPGATWMQREPTAISLVATAIPNMPVRSHRPMIEKVVNSMPCSNGRSGLSRVLAHHPTLLDHEAHAPEGGGDPRRGRRPGPRRRRASPAPGCRSGRPSQEEPPPRASNTQAPPAGSSRTRRAAAARTPGSRGRHPSRAHTARHGVGPRAGSRGPGCLASTSCGVGALVGLEENDPGRRDEDHALLAHRGEVPLVEEEAVLEAPAPQLHRPVGRLPRRGSARRPGAGPSALPRTAPRLPVFE